MHECMLTTVIMQPIIPVFLVVIGLGGWTVCCEASNITRTTDVGPRQPYTVSDSTTTIRYLIVGIAGGLLAVTVVMVALVFTLACYFSTSNIYWRLRRTSRPATVITVGDSELAYENPLYPLYRQESGDTEPAKLVPSLGRAAKGSTTTVIVHEQETNTMGYNQSNQPNQPIQPAKN